MKETERVGIGSISETTRESFEIAFIADVALNWSGLGDVWKVLDGAFLAHFDDGIDGDVSETNMDIA